MSIQPIANASSGIFSLPLQEANQSTDKGGLFQALLGNVEDISNSEKVAKQNLQDVILGKRDDLHNVLIEFEKINLDVKFTKAVVDRAASAFTKLMDTQL